MTKKAIVSLVDDHTALDYVVMMKSLKDSNPELYDTIDKHLFTFGSLCDENRSVIQALFPTLKETVINPVVSNLSYSGGREWGENPSTTYQPHYRYEIFNLTGYDNLVYLDTDLLIQGNIEKLFTTPSGRIGASKKWAQQSSDNLFTKRYNTALSLQQKQNSLGDSLDSFNAGVLSFGDGITTPQTKDRLLKLQQSQKTPGNQQILNQYFEKIVDFIPQTYNFATEFYSDTVFKTRPNLDDQHIIHFVGPDKPSHLLKPHTRRLVDMVLYFVDGEKPLYKNIRKYVRSNPQAVVKIGFGDHQQDVIDTEGCLELWLRWFKVLEDTGVFIKPKPDVISVTRQMD